MLQVSFELYGDHRVLHVLSHSIPTRRSSDLPAIAPTVRRRRRRTPRRMLRAPADAVPKVRPASPATASPVRETRMKAWKRSRTSPVEKRDAMIRANRRRRLDPSVLKPGRGRGFGMREWDTRGRGDVDLQSV